MGGGRQKINGETIAGIALVFLALLFIWAGFTNPVWSVILLADYVILAIGIGFIVIGTIAIGRYNRKSSHPEEHPGRY
ncbi:MAG TPA: hypothetical protein VLA68_00610 [Nitrososphaera sp.]|nr:hypothetical protein [Nitrososphaera sp.]